MENTKDNAGINYLLKLGPYAVEIARAKLNADAGGRSFLAECKRKYTDDYPETIISLTATALALETRLALAEKNLATAQEKPPADLCDVVNIDFGASTIMLELPDELHSAKFTAGAVRVDFSQIIKQG